MVILHLTCIFLSPERAYPPVSPTQTERHFSRRFVRWIVIISGLVVAMVAGTAGVGLWIGLEQSRSSADRALSSSVQLLEQGLTRSVESIDVLLASLARRVGDTSARYGTASDFANDPAISSLAHEMMRFAPHVRQILVIDQQGVIRYDSAPSPALNKQLNLFELGIAGNAPRSLGRGLHVGLPVPGRFLGAEGLSPPGLSLIPVAYAFSFRTPNGSEEQFYTVAALNPGFLQDSFDAVVAQDRGGIAEDVVLARYDGPVLMARTASTSQGSQHSHMPSLLPALLSAAIEKTESGAIASPLPVLSVMGRVHWQVSARYPLVVAVGRSDQAVLQSWYTDQRPMLIFLPIMLVSLLVVIGGLAYQILVRSRLQDQVRVLSQAIEQGPTAVLITDARGHIQYINRAFTTTTGYHMADIKGQTPRLIKSGLMDEQIYQDLWGTITSGRVWGGELLNRTKDGSLRWMAAAISAVRNEEGIISHFVAVETDVTERKRLDQHLAEVQKLAEGLLALPLILYRINHNGTITDALGAGIEQLSLSRQALIGRRYDDIFPGCQQHVSLALAGESTHFECISHFAHHTVCLEHFLVFDPARPDNPLVKHPTATDGSVDEHGFSYDKGGAIGIALDVTARRQAEARLSATIDRLNASNHELEQFAYVASHDLQEPLRIVSSYMSLLKRRYGGKLDADADTFIGYAMNGAQRMQSLILDLLQLSRIGTQGKELKPVDLSPVLETALANLELSIKENQASILINDPLPMVLGDDQQLTRLFQNLISNALKYHHPNRPPIITLSCRLDGGMWHLIFEDNGLGIAEPFREKIFLIFQRLQTRDESQGNGIGLAICRKIAERHGGSIWVDGEEGKGSRFHVTLRRQDDIPVDL